MSWCKISQRIRVWIKRAILLTILLSLLGGSSVQFRETSDRVHRYTRPLEFDFLTWTMDAVVSKVGQLGLGPAAYIPPSEGRVLVRGYFELLEQVQRAESELRLAFGDPTRSEDDQSLQDLIAQTSELRGELDLLQPVVESVLQGQVSMVLAAEGLQVGGVPFPPVVFRFTQPPKALIVSPRDVIRQDANISLEPDVDLAGSIELERHVEAALDVSALVVPTGGIGIYPTMVQETTSLGWVVETIVHEWIHNYLTLHPLGLNYYSSPELRTMNETVAAILGQELGRDVLLGNYPEIVPAAPPEGEQESDSVREPPAFDFRAEMYETRINVDRLLAQGEIEEAEAYMERRRVFLWEHGYRIRRLNQAYFAFHGAYADEARGAAGEDPVGAAVRELWALSASPLEFLRSMAWMNDYDDLQRTLNRRR